MASMVLRASRGAASSACGWAAVAASGSGVAAAASRLLRGFPIASRSFVRGMGCDRGDSPVSAPPLENNPDPYRGKVKFVAEDKDLESDEAIWALYERWCKAFGEKRDQDEMRRRFNRFKEMVLFVDRANKEAIRAGDSVRWGINRFTDGKHRELMTPAVPYIEYLMRLPFAPNIKVTVNGIQKERITEDDIENGRITVSSVRPSQRD